MYQIHRSLARAIQRDVGLVKQDVKDVAQAIHCARLGKSE